MSAPLAIDAIRRPFRIGELAARTGRSIHTIRWYEAQGLIPGVQRDAGGRRLYTDRHVGWLELMERLRRTGMSIATMRDYTRLVRMGSASLRERRALLGAHRVQVKARLDEWHDALALLERKIAFYEKWLATGRRPADPILRSRTGSTGAVRRRA